MQLVQTLKERAKSGFRVQAFGYDISIRLARAYDPKRTAIGKVVARDIAVSRLRLNGLGLSLDPTRLSIRDQLVVLDLYRTCIGLTNDDAREVLVRETLFRSFRGTSADPLRSEIAEKIAASYRRSGSPEEAMRIIRRVPATPRLKALAEEIDRELDLAANAFPDHVARPANRIVAGRHEFMRDIVDREPELFASRAVLHVAPERDLHAVLVAGAEKRKMQYVTLDAFSSGAAVKDDLRSLDIPDASFDTILCHHVLEHILEDMAALRELRRILRPGGVLHVSVPQNGLLADTIEWGIPDVNTISHVRMYGADFVDRLEDAGFACAKCVYLEPCYIKPDRVWRRPYYICQRS